MAAPVASPKDPASPPPPAGSALVRQLALLGVLVVLLGMLGYDLLVLGPAAEKADKDLEAKVSEKNQAGIKPGAEGASRDRDEHLVTSNDIHKWMGWGPSKKLNKGFYTLEYYNNWGVIPIPRQYICVVYQTGKNGAPDLYASHHRNREPEEQDLPRDPAKVPPPTNPNPPSEPTAGGRNIPGVRPSGEEGTEGKTEPSEKPAESTEPSEKPEKTEKTADPPAEKTPATEGDEK